MSNDELLAKLEKTEKELADSHRIVNELLNERETSWNLACALMPFMDEAKLKIKGINVQQYKEQLKQLLKRMDETPPDATASANPETSGNMH
jgi:hypothetical protein